MRIVLGLAVSLALPTLGAADLPKLPAETMGLIDAARGVPPEFSADLLLRLAESRVIGDSAWKRALIEEAFAAGAHAQLPYSKKGEPSTDTRTSRLYWGNQLDALSLQTRAVEAMLAVKPVRAREMFEDIATPQVPALSCKETGTAILTAYYSTAAKVFQAGFTAEQQKASQHVSFLARLIAEMQTPAHVTPGLKLVRYAQVTPEQRQDLLARFSGMLDHVNGSARVFGAAAGDLVSNAGDGSPILMPSLRAYIVRHVSGPRCSDDSVAAGQLTFAAFQFNSLIAKLDPAATRFKAITEEEAKPSKDEGTFEHHPWWQSKRSKQVIAALQWLNHGNRQLPDDKRFFTLEERMSSDWDAHYLDTLKLIEGWTLEEEDSPDDWFGMVSEAYGLLARLVPPDERREGVMKRFLNFMETHYADVESHNLWFTQLKGLWNGDAWLSDKCAESKNPVIALYAKVGKVSKSSGT